MKQLVNSNDLDKYLTKNQKTNMHRVAKLNYIPSKELTIITEQKDSKGNVCKRACAYIHYDLDSMIEMYKAKKLSNRLHVSKAATRMLKSLTRYKEDLENV